MNMISQYLPAALFAVGACATYIVGTPRPTPLVRPLAATMPAQFMGVPGKDVPISLDEQRGSGVTDYFQRSFAVTAADPVSLYIGYHATQQGESRMHSPTLCLPGSGWTPIDSRLVTVMVAGQPIHVNRYMLQKSKYRILVYYWFQGRGRITTGEAQLKLHTFVDALLLHRDEEALVRIIVPLPAVQKTAGKGAAPPVQPDTSIQGNPSAPAANLPPDSVAVQLAAIAIPALNQSLPQVSR